MTALRLPLLALALFALPVSGDGPAKNYARPELLVEPAELAKPEVAANYRILDVRPRKDYQAGHVPGAVWADPALWAKTFAQHQEPKAWAELIGKLGIDGKTHVVAYDGAGGKEAARVWWILRYWGHKDASLLNGGWQGYRDAGHAVSKDEPAVTAKRYDVGAARKQYLATKQDVLEVLKGKQVQIIDARSEGEHCGTVELAKRAGAIPGALNLEWSAALDKKTNRFRPAESLTKLFKDAGIDLDRPAVAHCQSGGRSAFMVFTMELMGAKDARNYYRSWSEWGNDPDTPIVTPKKK